MKNVQTEAGTSNRNSGFLLIYCMAEEIESYWRKKVEEITYIIQ
jgi:hypothetical protein